jgi:hypothetical protein
MTKTMSCPKCGFVQTPSDACLRCGIVFSKFGPINERDETIPEIEKKLEKSLDRYFKNSPSEELDEALATFQYRKRVYRRLVIGCFALCFAGVILGFIFRTAAWFFIGILMFLAGFLALFVGAFLIYRCPLCGQTLILSPRDSGSISGGRQGLQVWPPPGSCPNCQFSLT